MGEELPFLSKRLRELRAAAGMTQQQLAVAAGLSVSLVSQIEQGTNADPKVSTVTSLARALGVGVASLIEVQMSPAPPMPAPVAGERQRRRGGGKSK